MTADQRWVPQAGSRTYAKGDRRKEQIVQAAFRAFAAEGFRGASMVQIAAACGVSRAGLLHHFPSKELLLAAVLEERDRVNGELFFKGSDPKADGADYFRRLQRVIAHNSTQPQVVRLFATLSVEAADPSHPAHDYFQNRYRWLRADIADALTDLARRGMLQAGADTGALSAQIVALMDGLQVQWLLDDQSVDPQALLAQRLAELMTGPSAL